MRRADRPLIYADSSALIKLVIEEAESAALEHHLTRPYVSATSRIAVVEVSHSTAIANPSEEVREEVDKLLAYDRRLLAAAGEHGLL